MEQPSDYSIFPEKEVVYASFWQRFAAAIIDGIVVGVINGIVYFVAPRTNIISVVLAWLYFALQECGQQQATLGKRAMNIKVTDLNGGRITFGQATGRYFGKWVSCIIIFIGFLMMLWSDKRQTLHDMMAGTLVVSAD